jgi:hypothetical protein
LQQARRYREFPVVDFGQFVEPLRMHGLPFEAEAQEYRGRVRAAAGKVVGADDLDGAPAQGCALDQYAQCLGHPQHAHGEAEGASGSANCREVCR